MGQNSWEFLGIVALGRALRDGQQEFQWDLPGIPLGFSFGILGGFSWDFFGIFGGFSFGIPWEFLWDFLVEFLWNFPVEFSWGIPGGFSCGILVGFSLGTPGGFLGNSSGNLGVFLWDFFGIFRGFSLWNFPEEFWGIPLGFSFGILGFFGRFFPLKFLQDFFLWNF